MMYVQIEVKSSRIRVGYSMEDSGYYEKNVVW